jgi:hypothetical protein
MGVLGGGFGSSSKPGGITGVPFFPPLEPPLDPPGGGTSTGIGMAINPKVSINLNGLLLVYA